MALALVGTRRTRTHTPPQAHARAAGTGHEECTHAHAPTSSSSSPHAHTRTALPSSNTSAGATLCTTHCTAVLVDKAAHTCAACAPNKRHMRHAHAWLSCVLPSPGSAMCERSRRESLSLPRCAFHRLQHTRPLALRARSRRHRSEYAHVRAGRTLVHGAHSQASAPCCRGPVRTR